MIRSVDVQITAPVYDTEIADRVKTAVTNIFPDADLEEKNGEIIGTAHSMGYLSEKLHEQRILDTARKQFFNQRRGDTFSFSLKKQAAFVDRVNFAVGEPDELGEIYVRVRVEEPEIDEYIDMIAPQTEDGSPVTEDN